MDPRERCQSHFQRQVTLSYDQFSWLVFWHFRKLLLWPCFFLDILEWPLKWLLISSLMFSIRQVEAVFAMIVASGFGFACSMVRWMFLSQAGHSETFPLPSCGLWCIKMFLPIEQVFFGDLSTCTLATGSCYLSTGPLNARESISKRLSLGFFLAFRTFCYFRGSK